MNHIARMDEIRCIQQLVHDVPFVDVFEYRAALNHIMQIALHEFKRQINVHVIGSSAPADRRPDTPHQK